AHSHRDKVSLYHRLKLKLIDKSLYILAILNLILAIVAIACVAKAQQNNSEYFFLVYISVSIFIFYMATIVFIILLQIIETFSNQKQQNKLENHQNDNFIQYFIDNDENDSIVDNRSQILNNSTSFKNKNNYQQKSTSSFILLKSTNDLQKKKYIMSKSKHLTTAYLFRSPSSTSTLSSYSQPRLIDDQHLFIWQNHPHNLNKNCSSTLHQTETNLSLITPIPLQSTSRLLYKGNQCKEIFDSSQMNYAII
ncbi:unnamed protein product, partial [Didymodactylos carnosus]